MHRNESNQICEARSELVKRTEGHAYLEAHAEGEGESDEDEEHGEGGEEPAAEAQAALLLLPEDGGLPAGLAAPAGRGEGGLAVGLQRQGLVCSCGYQL